MDKKQKLIYGMFSRLTEKYDLFNRIASFGLDSYWRRRALKFVKCNDDVLDVGTGTGEFLLELVKRINHKGELTGIDFCESMLEKALKKSKKAKVDGRINFKLAKAEELPFSENSFNVVLSGFVMRNVVDNIEMVLREMYRVLKQNGRVIILELYRPRYGWLREIYHFYLKGIVSVEGKLIFKEEWLSNYLENSIKNFFTPDDFLKLIAKTKFRDVQYIPLHSGIVGIHTGIK